MVSVNLQWPIIQPLMNPGRYKHEKKEFNTCLLAAGTIDEQIETSLTDLLKNMATIGNGNMGGSHSPISFQACGQDRHGHHLKMHR